MVIGLYGIHGTYNFGCEAIVRGATQFVSDVFPEAKIKYLSYSYEFDRKALFDLDIEVVPIKEKKTFVKRCINKVLRVFNVNRQYFYFDMKSLLSDVDMILSIGGDIYTIPSVYREKEKYLYYNSLIDFCNKSRKPIAVYGASVGPWGVYDRAIKYYSCNMKKYKAILCREQCSVDYLNKLQFNNMVFFPDPAFQLGTGKNNRGDFIGINLSPLSFYEVYGSYGEEQIVRMARLIDELCERFNRPILFLPHVLSNVEGDNDLWFLEKIMSVMNHRDNVTIADSKGGFLGIKQSIQNCHIVISARMHCAINAMEENVPTIMLAYSQKSIGMCEYIYGENQWCVSLKDLEATLINRINEMDQRYEEIVGKLSKRNEKIRLEYKEGLDKVKEMLS